MADHTETQTWVAGIFRRETVTPALGGEDSPFNLPIKQLANRTAFLKAHQELATAHIANTANPHGTTKAHVGLGNCDNTSDANKPVSTATQTALNLKANLASPALTGTPTAPTAALGTNTTQLATMAAIQAAIANLINSAPGALDQLNELAAALGNDANFAATMTTALALKAPLASPAFTGTPTAPTAAPGTNTTQVANMAAVHAAATGRKVRFVEVWSGDTTSEVPWGSIVGGDVATRFVVQVDNDAAWRPALDRTQPGSVEHGSLQNFLSGDLGQVRATATGLQALWSGGLGETPGPTQMYKIFALQAVTV